MKASIILNQFGNIGFFYAETLGIEPEWAALDAERGEIYIYNSDGESKSLQMDGLTDSVYNRIIQEQKILLVQVLDNDITKPVKAIWVSLMVSQQI